MAYREALMADARKWGDAVFASSIRILEAEYRKAERREAVRQTFAELFGQWGERTEEEAASLGICFLHSSILMRTGEIRLTLYGKEFYMDRNQLEKEWHPPCFFQQYEHDMSEIMERLRKDHPRIYPYEEDAVRFQQIPHAGAGKHAHLYFPESDCRSGVRRVIIITDSSLFWDWENSILI